MNWENIRRKMAHSAKIGLIACDFPANRYRGGFQCSVFSFQQEPADSRRYTKGSMTMAKKRCTGTALAERRRRAMAVVPRRIHPGGDRRGLSWRTLRPLQRPSPRSGIRPVLYRFATCRIWRQVENLSYRTGSSRCMIGVLRFALRLAAEGGETEGESALPDPEPGVNAGPRTASRKRDINVPHAEDSTILDSTQHPLSWQCGPIASVPPSCHCQQCAVYDQGPTAHSGETHTGVRP